jgi:plastocyanin
MIGQWMRQASRGLGRTAFGLAAAALFTIEAQTAVRAQAADQALTSSTSAEIRQFTFSPSPLVVSPGASVMWTNRDAIEHSVTSGSPDAPGNAFDSGFLSQEQAFSIRFDEPGEYAYFCRRHPFMQGTLTVAPATL